MRSENQVDTKQDQHATQTISVRLPALSMPAASLPLPNVMTTIGRLALTSSVKLARSALAFEPIQTAAHVSNVPVRLVVPKLAVPGRSYSCKRLVRGTHRTLSTHEPSALVCMP